uniref:Uncharacterized protein n=1 Tax=Amphimedon queenslandica TaxID=400682 RepID=A0A1X7U5N2_AMPQE
MDNNRHTCNCTACTAQITRVHTNHSFPYVIISIYSASFPEPQNLCI